MIEKYVQFEFFWMFFPSMKIDIVFLNKIVKKEMCFKILIWKYFN